MSESWRWPSPAAEPNAADGYRPPQVSHSDIFRSNVVGTRRGSSLDPRTRITPLFGRILAAAALQISTARSRVYCPVVQAELVLSLPSGRHSHPRAQRQLRRNERYLASSPYPDRSPVTPAKARQSPVLPISHWLSRVPLAPWSVLPFGSHGRRRIRPDTWSRP